MRQVSWQTLAALLPAVVVACAQPPAGIRGDGTLALELTAAPFVNDSVARADMFIVRVEGMVPEIDSSVAAQAADAGANTNPETGFVTLAVPNESYNLVDLHRDVTVSLGATPLPLGAYRGFRLILDPSRSSITLMNGTVLTASSTPGIQWTTGSRLGVRIQLDRPIDVEFSETRMLVDFDLNHSFPLQGATLSTGGVRFASGIRGAIRDSTGSVSGTVRQDTFNGLPVADARVDVLPAGTSVGDTASSSVVRTTRTDAQGRFKLSFVAPGAYGLRAYPPPSHPLYAPALLGFLTIAPSTEANGNVLVLIHN